MGSPYINLYSNIPVEVLYPDPAYQQSAKSHHLFSSKYQAKAREEV